MSILVEIVTPVGVVCSKDVDSLILDTSEGEIQILPDHRPLISLLEVGFVRMVNGTSEEKIAISKGLLNYENNFATILVGEAIDITSSLELEQNVLAAEKSGREIFEKIHQQGILEQEELNRLEAKIRAKINKNLDKKNFSS